MEINNLLINPGAPVKSSIPLVGHKFGQGFGLKSPSGSIRSADQGVLVDLSGNAKNRTNKNSSATSSLGTSASDSPLSQALNALSDITDKIAALQQKYSKETGDSANSKSLASEIGSLTQEFKRITSSDIFKSAAGSSSNNSSNQSPGVGSLAYNDSSLKNIFDSGDSQKIEAVSKGLSTLTTTSFDKVLTDASVTTSIKDTITELKTALSPQENSTSASQTNGVQNSNIINIPVPQASIKTIGQAQGLTVSLLSYSNEDFIRAAAAHVNIDSTNVLILTYDAPKPETEEEKKKREEQEAKVAIENPGKAATEVSQDAATKTQTASPGAS